jgi:tetraacyldisaccharide 4'-kinase
VLDDAFQHLRLKRDLDVVLLDQKHPLGNGRLLPRGPLREAPAALQRADAIVLTRFCGRPGMSPATGSLPGVMERPLFQCTHLPVGCWVGAGAGAPLPGDVPAALARDSSMLAGRRVLAFSGIAHNRAFVETVKDLGATLGQSLAFGDHHAYTPAACREICRRAVGLGVDSLVTTYKDYVKVAHLCDWPLPLAVLDVRISFGNAAAAFQALVRNAIAA